jgi:predicted nucleic acid-binding protein
MPGREAQRLIAVADASFVIGLSRIGQWKLLEAMAERVYVPLAVWDEVVERGCGRPGARELKSSHVVQTRAIRDRSAAGVPKETLGAGEAEAIVLAQEIPNATVLLDDPRARRAAAEAGLESIGLVGFLAAAKKAGLVAEIRPLLAALQAQGFHLSRTLVDGALRRAGELPG